MQTEDLIILFVNYAGKQEKIESKPNRYEWKPYGE
jgi:hypothetical protein